MNNSHFPPVLYVAFSAAAATIFGLNAVSVASPALAYQLQSNLADMSTATTVYLLAEILFMCSLPVFLRKTSIENLLRWGCGGFAASSLFCFLSPSLDILIIARIAQGAFGGCLLPLPLIFVQQYLPRELQYDGLNRYGLSTVVIPVLAPLITLSLPPEHVQWVFILVASLALPGAMIHFKSQDRPDPGTQSPTSFGNLFSFCVFTVGIGFIVWAIDHWHKWGGMSDITLSMTLIAGVTAMLCGAIWQTRYENPLFEWRLFTHAKACMFMFMTVLLGTIVYGLIYLVPLYAVSVHDAGPRTIFQVVAYAAIPQVIMYPVVIRFKHYLTPHISVCAGFSILAIMAYYFSLSGVDFGPGEMWKIQTLRAVGIILMAIPFNALLIAATPPGLEIGMGVQYNFLRTLGGAVSIAIINTYVTSRTSVYQQDALAYGTGEASSQLASSMAFNDVFLPLSGLLVTAAIISLTMQKKEAA